MPIQVQGPDGQQFEFPDGTDQNVMRLAMQKHYGAPKRQANANGVDPMFANVQSGSMSTERPRYADAPAGLTLAPSRSNLTLRTDANGNPAPLPANVPPKRSGIGGMALNAGDALQQHLGNAGAGLTQLIAHGVDSGIGAIAPGSDTAAAVHNFVASRDAGMQQREQQYQARTDDATPLAKAGAYGGAAVGEIAPWALGIGELRAAGALPQASTKLGKLASLMGEGAVMGVAAPVNDGGENYWTEKGKQIGVGAAAAPLAVGGIKLAGAGVGAARNAARLASPSGRQSLARAQIGAKLDELGVTPDVLRGASPVEGFNYTLAQASPSPEVVQYERALRNGADSGPAFARAHADQNAALFNAVQGIARTPEELAAARASRATNAASFRDTNMPAGGWDVAGSNGAGAPMVPAEPLIQQLQILAQHSDGAVSGAAKSQLAQLQEQSLRQGGGVDVHKLDEIGQAIGRKLREANLGQSVPASVTHSYGPLKNSITDTIESRVPGYRDYLARYAQDSQPINDMEAGQNLLSRLSSRGLDTNGGADVGLNDIRSALSKNEGAEFGYSPEAEQTLNDVLSAIQKRSISNNKIGAAGSNTVSDANGLAALLKHHGLKLAGGALGGTLGALGGPITSLGGAVVGGGVAAARQNVLKRVGELAANAPEAASALEDYLRYKTPNRANKLLQLLQPYTLTQPAIQHTP